MSTPENHEALAVGGGPVYHGYAPPTEPAVGFRPPLTITLSRQTGAMGRHIARRTAELLDCQRFDQEKLEYLAQDNQLGWENDQSLPESAQEWIAAQTARLRATGLFDRHPQLADLARVFFGLTARERSVVLGRGVGYLLPAVNRLMVRLVARREDRVAHIAQFDRMSEAEAEKFVDDRDESYHRFVRERFGVDPGDVSQYDLVVNSSWLGVEGSAQVIVHACNMKRLGQTVPTDPHDDELPSHAD